MIHNRMAIYLANVREHFPPTEEANIYNVSVLSHYKDCIQFNLNSLIEGKSERFCIVGIRIRISTQEENATYASFLNRVTDTGLITKLFNKGPICILLTNNTWIPYTYPLSSTFISQLNVSMEIMIPEELQKHTQIDIYACNIEDILSSRIPTIFLRNDNTIAYIFRPRALKVYEQFVDAGWFNTSIVSFGRGVKIIPSLKRLLDRAYPEWQDKESALQCDVYIDEPIDIFGPPYPFINKNIDSDNESEITPI